MYLIRHLIIFYCLCCTASALSQEVSMNVLNNLEYEELLTLFDEVKTDSISAEKVARTYLNRARREGDTIKMARGYDRLARIFHPEKNIAFADSIIKLTKDLDHITYPALGHMIKAYEYSLLFDYSAIIDQMYLAFEYSHKNDNILQELFTLNYIITEKSFWGDIDESIDLAKHYKSIVYSKTYPQKIKKAIRVSQHSSIEDFKIEDYNSASFNLIICYINAGKFNEAAKEINVLKTIDRFNDESNRIFYLKLQKFCELEIAYYTNDYVTFYKIIDFLQTSKNLDFNLAQSFDIHLFKGLASIRLKKESKGIIELLKADSIYIKTQLRLKPYQRSCFQSLLNYYKKMGDVKKQLHYYEKLSKIDSVFKINYKYFESEVTNRIEVPLLLNEKEQEISNLQALQKESKVFINWLWLSAIIFLIANFFLIRKHFLYRKRVQRLMTQSNKTTSGPSSYNSPDSLRGLTSELVKEIMDKLERFEQTQKYRNSEISLHKLAKRFKTNARYLSKVVNFKKEKNFSQYLNDLRVDYSLEALKSDPNYRKYTIKAIAELSGFSSAESYSRSFKKKFGVHPSYFIKQLLKDSAKTKLNGPEILPESNDSNEFS